MSASNYAYPLIAFHSNDLYKTLALQVETENGGLTWWGALLILGLVILVVILAFAWNASRTSASHIEHPTGEVHEAVEPHPAPSPAADDLAVIEGIGPKITSLLQENGIMTFDQLAHAGLDELKAILQEANLRIADPSTWSEQAELAARGDWTALQALQDRLKGGRF